MNKINLQGFTNLQECLEKALPPIEGEVRKYKDGDYKFTSGKWKKLKQGEEKAEEDKKEEKLPTMLFRNEIEKYFSYNNLDDVKRIWMTTKTTKVQADNGKKYEAKYDYDKWGNGVIKFKRLNN